MMLILLSLLVTLSNASATFCTRNAATVGFTIGSARAMIVTDGTLPLPTDTFLVPEAVIRSYGENFREPPFLLQQNILVVDLDAGRTIVETGLLSLQNEPVGMQAGLLMDALRSVNVTADSIDNVLITHGHSSRVGGLLTLDGQLAFPNATVYVSRAEHEFWTTDPIPTRPDNEDFIPGFASTYRATVVPYDDVGRLRLVEENGRPFDGVQFLSSRGHTPGHVAISVTVDGEQLLVSGDSWATRADQIQNPSWQSFVEDNADEAFSSRIEVLEMAAEQRIPILSYHENFPGLGYIRKDRDAFDFVAMSIPNIDVSVSRKCG